MCVCAYVSVCVSFSVCVLLCVMGICNHDYVKVYVVILLNVVHEHAGFDGMIGLYDDLTVFPLCVASVVEGKMRAAEARDVDGEDNAEEVLAADQVYTATNYTALHTRHI